MIIKIKNKNASVNKPVINTLCRVFNQDFGDCLFYVLCACHIFNLIVQDKMKYISKQIGRNRDALLYITISPSRK